MYLTETTISEIEKFFAGLQGTAKKEGWHKDSQWTVGINAHLAHIAHQHGFLVFASRCESSNGPEWLYDHHWRVKVDGELSGIPLAMEIEWGFGSPTLRKRVREDFLKLVQARVELRVMVFSAQGVSEAIGELIGLAERFEETSTGDRYLFVGFELGEEQPQCRLWCAP